MTREKAIEVVKEAMPTLWKETKDAIQTLIPELAESEDERIRKHLIAIVELYWGKTNDPDKAKDLAYLEKQKGQNLSNTECIEYEENLNLAKNAIGMISDGACYMNNLNRKEVIDWLENVPETIKQLTTKIKELEKQKEQKLITFEEPCNSDEYEVVEIGDATCLRRKEQKPTEQFEDNEEKSIGTTLINALNGNARLEWELKRAGVNIKKLITYLEQKEQKSVDWSEEDRKMLNTIISDGSRGVEFDAKQVNFLKSLCPQYRWKLSEQEKSALRGAIHILTEERNFPKTAAHLQNILDAFESEEPRKDWTPSQEQMRAVFDASERNDKLGSVLRNLYDDLKKL